MIPISLARVATRALHLFDPEWTHNLALIALQAGFAPAGAPPPHSLRTTLWGRSFPSAIGIAAGFDKNGEAIAPLLRLGAGFVEIGAVTPRPQPGNPRPRLFRLVEDRAVINRFGFNNDGHAVVAARLGAFRHYSRWGKGRVGVNLGMNKDSEDAVADYVAGVQAFEELADFLTVNVSSPNTQGLRDLQAEDRLLAVLSAAREAMRGGEKPPALLVKIAPDLSDTAAENLVARVTTEGLVDGWICTNTTLARSPDLKSRHVGEAGGLSGPPVAARSTELIRLIYRASGGASVVGVGGIDSAQAAYAKIRAGASVLQLYTAMVYGGLGIIPGIAYELGRLLLADGFNSIAEAVGSDSR